MEEPYRIQNRECDSCTHEPYRISGDLEPEKKVLFPKKSILWKWRSGKDSEKISGSERCRVSGLCGERRDGTGMDAQRKETEGVCLLGTISNSDTSFEMNSVMK